MYEAFFGLNRRPFGASPDADCLVPVDTMQQALDGLRNCVQSGGEIGVVTAPPGLGKTLLCRKLIAELADSFQAIFLPNSNLPTKRSLLQAVLYELGQPYTRMAEQELRLELTTAVREVRPNREGVLLVIDEAHLLNERLLEEVRTATNLIEDGAPLVRVVLSGQPALEEKLLVPGLDALNQRIRAQVMLEPLTRSESAQYIAHRLAWAGIDVEQAISEEALQLICHCADGVPRCLNQLCDQSLCLSAGAGVRPVDAARVHAALEELKRLPLQWNEPIAPPTGSAGDTPVQERAEIEISLSEELAIEEEDDELTSIESLDCGGSIEVGADAPLMSNEQLPPNETIRVIDLDPLSEPEGHSREPAASAWGGSQPPSEADAIAFEEEVVVDRYAMLDAGHNSFSELVIDQASIEVSPGGDTLQWDSTRDSEDWRADEPGLPSDVLDAAEHSGPREDFEAERNEVRPDLDLDAIVPLLDVALDAAGFAGPAHVAESEIVFADQILENSEHADAAQPYPAFESQAPELGPQQAPAAEVQEVLNHHMEFDIVLPEVDDEDVAESAPVLETDAEHQTPPARHYRRMFSELRRRVARED